MKAFLFIDFFICLLIIIHILKFYIFKLCRGNRLSLATVLLLNWLLRRVIRSWIGMIFLIREEHLIMFHLECDVTRVLMKRLRMLLDAWIYIFVRKSNGGILWTESINYSFLTGNVYLHHQGVVSLMMNTL